MNLKGWMDEILEKLSGTKEILTEIKREPHYLPYAGYIKGKKNELIRINCNPPSLVRYGLAHLLAHELAHRKHLELYDTYGDDFSEVFRDLEWEYIQKIWEICNDEHE
jgi:Zn-dependent peptidase ImmA (M78 family)